MWGAYDVDGWGKFNIFRLLLHTGNWNCGQQKHRLGWGNYCTLPVIQSLLPTRLNTWTGGQVSLLKLRVSGPPETAWEKWAVIAHKVMMGSFKFLTQCAHKKLPVQDVLTAHGDPRDLAPLFCLPETTFTSEHLVRRKCLEEMQEPDSCLPPEASCTRTEGWSDPNVLMLPHHLGSNLPVKQTNQKSFFFPPHNVL